MCFYFLELINISIELRLQKDVTILLLAAMALGPRIKVIDIQLFPQLDTSFFFRFDAFLVSSWWASLDRARA